MVGRQPLKLLAKVRILLPELWEIEGPKSKHLFRGRLTGRTSVSEAANVGSTPALGIDCGELPVFEN